MKKERAAKWILIYGSIAAAFAGVIYFNNHEEKLEKQIAQELFVRDSINTRVDLIVDTVKNNNLSDIIVDINAFSQYLNGLDSSFIELASKKNYTVKDSVEQESLQQRIQYGLNKLRKVEEYKQIILTDLNRRDSIQNKIDSLYKKKWIK